MRKREFHCDLQFVVYQLVAPASTVSTANTTTAATGNVYNVCLQFSNYLPHDAKTHATLQLRPRCTAVLRDRCVYMTLCWSSGLSWLY